MRASGHSILAGEKVVELLKTHARQAYSHVEYAGEAFGL
jgi:hypothetical protein